MIKNINNFLVGIYDNSLTPLDSVYDRADGPCSDIPLHRLPSLPSPSGGGDRDRDRDRDKAEDRDRPPQQQDRAETEPKSEPKTTDTATGGGGIIVASDSADDTQQDTIQLKR